MSSCHTVLAKFPQSFGMLKSFVTSCTVLTAPGTQNLVVSHSSFTMLVQYTCLLTLVNLSFEGQGDACWPRALVQDSQEHLCHLAENNCHLPAMQFLS